MTHSVLGISPYWNAVLLVSERIAEDSLVLSYHIQMDRSHKTIVVKLQDSPITSNTTIHKKLGSRVIAIRDAMLPVNAIKLLSACAAIGLKVFKGADRAPLVRIICQKGLQDPSKYDPEALACCLKDLAQIADWGNPIVVKCVSGIANNIVGRINDFSTHHLVGANLP